MAFCCSSHDPWWARYTKFAVSPLSHDLAILEMDKVTLDGPLGKWTGKAHDTLCIDQCELTPGQVLILSVDLSRGSALAALVNSPRRKHRRV